MCTLAGASKKVDQSSRTGSRNIAAAGFAIFFFALAGKQYLSCCKRHDKDFKIWGQEIWLQLMNCFEVARCVWNVEQALRKLRVVYMTCTPLTRSAGDCVWISLVKWTLKLDMSRKLIELLSVPAAASTCHSFATVLSRHRPQCTCLKQHVIRYLASMAARTGGTVRSIPWRKTLGTVRAPVSCLR